MPQLILASASPYRQALLQRLGLDFEVRPPYLDESARQGEHPKTLAKRLASEKARSITIPDALVIAADQVAILGEKLLRKPRDHATALQQLVKCQGQTALFYTATTVMHQLSGQLWEGLDETRVRFLSLEEAQLDQYLKLEQPYDCAGGFKAEGLGISLLETIECTDPTALLGLPLIWLVGVLRTVGLDPLEPSL